MSRRRCRPRIGIALLLAPAVTLIAILFLGAFAFGVAESLGYQPYLPGWHWSTSAYQALWHDSAARASWTLTLRVAALSTALATALGTAVALIVTRLGWGRRFVTDVLGATLAVPHVVGAVCMLLLLGQSGLLSRLTHAVGVTATPAAFPALTADRHGWGIVADYTWRETPFVAVVVLSALTSGVTELTSVAQTLGAGPWQRFRTVTAPLIAPAAGGSALLVLAFALGSYEVPAVLGRPYPATLPVVALRYEQDVDLAARPQALALATILALLIMAIAACYAALLPRLVHRRSG